jgi:DNA-directed RNA polymerase specialized sigma subunit
MHLLKIMLDNVPKSTHKGKTKHLENEFFEEYFNLVSVLIKACSAQVNLDYEDILSKGIDTIR